MASRRLAVTVTYGNNRRVVAMRSATRVDMHGLVLVIGLLALMAFAGVLYLSQASVAAELRYRLDAAAIEAADLWEQNIVLQQRIADMERLATVEKRAGHLGLVNAPAYGPYMACTAVDTPSLDNTVARIQDDARGADDGGGFWHGLALRLGLTRSDGKIAAVNVLQ
ncbi:MAG: hypothetical protein ACUVX9_01125 [Anaerolineae bacterium]